MPTNYNYMVMKAVGASSRMAQFVAEAGRDLTTSKIRVQTDKGEIMLLNSGNLSDLQRMVNPAARGYTSAQPNVPNNTWTQMKCVSTTFDRGYLGEDAPGVDPHIDSITGVFDFQKPGLYLCIGQIQWNSNATGQRIARIRQGTTVVTYQALNAVGGGNASFNNLSALVNIPTIAASLTLDGYQSSGGALGVDNSGSTHLQILRVGGAA